MKKTVLGVVIILPVMVMAQSFEPHIEARQTAFSEIETVVDKASDIIDGQNTDWNELNVVSQVLSADGDTLNVSFPVGSQSGSKATVDIWEKPEKFNSLLTQMDDAFKSLYVASQDHNVKAAESALKQAESSCRSCHRSYRSRW